MGGARSLIVRSLALRHAIKNTVRPLFNHHIHSRISKPSLLAVTLASSQLPSLHSSHHSRSLCSASGLSISIFVFNFSIFLFARNRNENEMRCVNLHVIKSMLYRFSASPGVVLVNSEEEFNNILSKVQGFSSYLFYVLFLCFCSLCFIL